MSTFVPCNELPGMIPHTTISKLGASTGSHENVFTGAMSSEDGEARSTMETACELVHSLLDQISWNDAPPTNDGVSSSGGKSMHQNFSKQCHITPIHFEESQSSRQKESTQHNMDPSELWKALYEVRSKPAEQKLGNVTLATLCARTLQTVGKSSKPTKEALGFESMKSTYQSGRNSDQNYQKQKASWRRLRPGKPDKPVTPYGDIVVSRDAASKVISQKTSRGTERKQYFETEERDDASCRPEDQNHASGTRLQLFGSEYARYLSSTALAPRDLGSNRVKNIPRANFNGRRSHTARNIQFLEDAELSVLTGPITDILVTIGEEIPPKGYYRISQSAGGESFYLRERKAPIFINVKKEPNWDRAAQRPCLTALAIIFPRRKEFVPPGFSVVRRHAPGPKNNESPPVNLNLGDEEVFLCFRRSREGNPITGILPLVPSKQEYVPEGYTVLERTPRNHIATIQTHASQVFLAYRQRLANLEPLRPTPLVISVHKGSSTNRKLNAYYCTGGTVVESRVGRFHIMDRSTHSLLSPSSISNRLSLIEASRRKTLSTISKIPDAAGECYVYSMENSVQKPVSSSEALTSSLLLAHGLGTSGSRSVMSDFEKLSSIGDVDSQISSENRSTIHCSVQGNSKSGNHSISTTSTTTEEDCFNMPRFASAAVRNIYTSEDKDIERCLDALSFIPVVTTAVDENDPSGMLLFQARVAILAPVLTACYTRHGGSALLAVEGLKELLHADFFSSDVNMEQDSSTRITLLDIAIQVVSDVATMGTQETHLQACVEFVQAAVKHGCGHLNARTVGYVLRFYLFVFYFGVTVPGARGTWGTVNGRDHYLLEDARTNSIAYLPGGAPQAAILSLKDLITFSIARLQALVNNEIIDFQAKNLGTRETCNGVIDGIICEVVDRSVHRVDIANYTQLAMHQIHRSGGSELFWYDMMYTCGFGLFGNDNVLRDETKSMYSLLFAILANCVKVASTTVRKDKRSLGVPRDIASKLMSLEMIHFFLLEWDAAAGTMEVSDSNSLSTFIFAIRRLVVPCLLSNTKGCLEDPRIYRRIVKIIGVLWCSPIYRRQMKLEIGILIDHFVLQILYLGPQILYREEPRSEEEMIYLFAQQIELMKALRQWFTDSRGLLEIFLNFDTSSEKRVDDSTSQELFSHFNWNIVQKICAALCDMSEQCGEFIAGRIKESQTMPSSHGRNIEIQGLQGISGTTLARESAQRLRKSAMDAIAKLVQTLAETVAMAQGLKYHSIVDSWGIHLDCPCKIVTSIPALPRASIVEQINPRTGNETILGFWPKAIKKQDFEVEYEGEDAIGSKVDHLDIAFEIGREKGLQRAIDYLVACNILTPSPRDIASFLRLHRNHLKPVDLGRFLCESGADGAEAEYWNLIRFSYIRAISFVGMTLEQGLRHLLTNGGFYLPGEAQQIDRLITTFSQCYWEDNAGDSINCPFQDQDTVFLLSFAIIMLNTDLHKTIQKANGKKQGSHQVRKKMTKAEFTNNLRGARGKADDLSQDYLSTIYDSIAAHPIMLHDQKESDDTDSVYSGNGLKKRLSVIEDSAKSLDALLRGLSTHEYRFVTLEDYSHQMIEKSDLNTNAHILASNMLVQMWHQFHGLINAALDIAHLDLKGMEDCAIVLRYTLCLTICLDMPMERTAFLGQLGRYRLFNDWRRGEARELITSHSNESYRQEDWYAGIQEACSSKGKLAERGKLLSLELIDDLIGDLGLNISVDVESRKATRDAVCCLYNADHLLNDPNRHFLRTGRLYKRANRSGRLVDYQFFLFSDVLIYAKKISNSSNKYKIHGELPLILMKVVDWFPPEQKREAKKGFQVYHPRKTFLVFASDRDERGSWVSSIRSAIDKEVSRKVVIEGARQAAAQSR